MTKRRWYTMGSAGVIGLLLLAGAAFRLAQRPAETPLHGLHAAEWQAHRRHLLSDSALARYYSFQDLTGEAGTFANLAGWTNWLSIAPADPSRAEPSFRIVEGRWPWKNALRLDEIPLETKPHTVAKQGFSFELWFRHHGQGMTPGGNIETAGTLLALGDGVWSGWKLTLLYPCNAVAFELGRPKPDPAVGVASFNRVPPGIWTHVAGTWDGEHISLYVNGLLSGRVPYSGEFFPVKSFNKFRIGHVGNGLGSVRFDVDEMALFDRCLTAEEILQHAWFEDAVSAEAATEFHAAATALVHRSFDEADRLLTILSENRALPEDLRELARLAQAQSLREQERYDECLPLFAQVCENSDLCDSVRRTAMLESTAILKGVKATDYQPSPVDQNQNVVPLYQLCPLVQGYEEAVDEFREWCAEEDAVRWMSRYPAEILPIVHSHCTKCHDDSNAQGGLDLAQIETGEQAGEEGDLWEKAAGRVERSEMPPAGHQPLSETDKRLFVRWVQSRPRSAFCEELGTEENTRYFRSHVSSRRLTRAEYRNAIRDLLGVVLTSDELPPQDGSGGEGFDTTGDVLFTSVVHLDAYLASAQAAVKRAIARESDNISGQAGFLLTPLPSSLDPQSEMSDLEAAETILKTFARRAWRRPVDFSGLSRLMRIYQEAASQGMSFEEAIQEPLVAVLVSPHFLFVVETEQPGAVVQRLTPHQMATRLALFLWSSVPDDELLDVADRGQIFEKEVLLTQLNRMLADSRARALGECFGLQWLGLREHSERRPDPGLFPDYTDELAADMREEAIRTVISIFQDNGSLMDLIDSDEVIVNGRLAQHYGLHLPADADWQRVPAGASHRGGIATTAAVLTATSYSTRTSPVLRGKWILNELLGTYVSPPPPGIPSLEQSALNDQPQSLRQRLERHRTQSECAVCHQTMDPLGFVLENYDAIGQWRDTDNGVPVDPSALLPDGQPIVGPDGLRNALRDRRREFERQFVRKLIGYALGRELDRFDECLLDRCLIKLDQAEGRAVVLLEEIISSFAFQHRYFKPSEAF